jgi:hypothetical protein
MSIIHTVIKLVENLAASRPAPKTPKYDNPWGAVLRYQDLSKGGKIYFESPLSSFEMWWEFSGGDALATVTIPNEEQWEVRTKMPLSTRQEVLKFIGNQIVADKISAKGSFVVGDSFITFFAG